MERTVRTRPRPLAYALSGAVADVAGAAAGHLTAGATEPSASPVLAVGTTVIDLTPTPVKEWAVATFGTADKPLLIGSVVLGSLALAGVAGLLARRRRGLGVALVFGLGAVAALTALVRPAAEAADGLPGLVAAGVGAAVLLTLLARLDHSAPAATRQQPAVEPPGDHRVSSRRVLLLASAGVGAASAAAAAGGQWLATVRSRIPTVALPAPSDPAPPLPAGLERRFSALSPFRTPNDRFYRVDTRLSLPVVDLDGWRLTIDGDVDREVSFAYADLAAMPLIERDITLTCVSNEVGGPYVGGARWLGIRLTDLLDRAGVGPDADQILSTDVDGFTISTPLAVATDGRDAMVALGMNGEPLPRAHGFPARLVTPGLYGFVGATKWLRRLTLTTYTAQQAYWTAREWDTDAPVKVSSRIDTPRPLARVQAGQQVVAGVAWAQHRGVGQVEVRVDGGPWRPARLGPDAGVDYWRQWYLPWAAEPGRRLLAVRATTLDGQVQTAARVTPFPGGATGIQEIVVQVD